MLALAAGAAIALTLAGSVALVLSRRSTEPQPSASAAPQTSAPKVAPPAETIPVTLNALPWARVRLTALDASVELPPLADADRTTPLQLQLAEGEYSLELENGGVTKPLVEKIQVRRGGTTDFVFTMPAYDAEAALAKSGWKR
jgi:hypothetical protein